MRTELWFDELGWRGRLFVGHYRQAKARSILSAHVHAGLFELCWLCSGVQVYAVGGRSYALRGGDCFVTRPDEIHSSAGNPQERGTLYWLQVQPPDPGGDFLGLAEPLVAGLFARLAALPRRVFPGVQPLQGHFDALLAASKGAPPAEQALRIAVEVVHILRLFADAAAARPVPRPGGDLGRVLALIDAQCHRRLPLPELAAAAGLSLPRFKAVFRAALGMPPAEFAMRRRLAAAQRALASGASVTAAALDHGFASSQHFATVCRRYTGRSPRQFGG